MMGRGPHAMGNIEKPKDARGALNRLIRYLGDYKVQLLIIALLTVVSSLMALAGPYLMGVAIDNMILAGDIPGLVRISLLLAGVYLFSALVSMASGWVMAIISQRSLKKLRKELFEHIQTLSLSFFDKRLAGDLMSRLTNDVDSIGMAISSNVTTLMSSSISLVGILVMMFSLNVWLASASLLVFPIMVYITAFIGGKTRAGFMALMTKMGSLNGVMQETITGQRVVIAFEQQESVNRKFTATNDEVKAISIKTNTYSMMMMPLMGILTNANIAIVAGLGAWMTLQGMATVGLIATFIMYSRRFADPLRQFGNIYNSIQSALAGAERIFEVIDTEPELKDASNAIGVNDFDGYVEFENVDFEYVPGVPVLKNISLKAEPGQTIALVGPTGAGKTTIVNLLTRFYDINDGSIKIDETDIRKIKMDDLRRQLGIVLQDVFLFSGTVMDNIRYGKLDATDEECVHAAELANADGFIRRLPKGYDTELSERAGNISQGQRQLISIARALVADPAILVLDEATSSVDTRTEIQIQEAFRRLMSGRTSFVIAHRLSTIRRADMVLVINNGEIIERGTHEELIEKKGFYYRVYMSQFKGTNGSDVEPIRLIPAEQTAPQFSQRGMPGMGGMSGIGGMGGMRSMGSTDNPGDRGNTAELSGHGSMRGGPGMPDMMGRMMEIVKAFREKGATSPEGALSLEELGLPPRFRMMMRSPMGQSGIFSEVDGKYYLSEERLNDTRAQFLNE
ncbi:ABC transporter ATP-binding protein [Candidatus Bathyarchaeota archaeon]|nr:ABC transporter ATP-binding protein [Candidatus Bathyarchaeota archaeon]MBL7168118.1 ABC transporter ATP-binding protein [Candidatus Bathyarchaeota archaeon]